MSVDAVQPVLANRPPAQGHASGVCAIVPIGQTGHPPLVHGMGILISDTEVVTCAHVVEYALKHVKDTARSGKVQIFFALAPSSIGAQLGEVDPKRWYPRTPQGDLPFDMAVVVLDHPAPLQVGRAVLVDGRLDHRTMVYGFRSKWTEKGMVSHGTGETRWGKLSATMLARGLGEFTSERFPVTTGYSGAGVYAERLGGVVGMIQTTNIDEEVTIAQFVPSRELTALRAHSGDQVRAAPRHTVDAVRIDKAIARKAEIEATLQRLSDQLVRLPYDADLIAALTPLMSGTSGATSALRISLGLPAEVDRAMHLLGLVGPEGAGRVQLGLIAQRSNHFLWRLRATLETIPTEWARSGSAAAQALEGLCAPFLTAVRPNLADGAKAIRSGNFNRYAEAAADTELYAVMRSIPREEGEPPPLDVNEKSDQSVVLNYLYERVAGVAEGTDSAEDSSNLWWAARLGIFFRDPRFAQLLPAAASRLLDIRVPVGDVTKRSVVPEIYTALRTASYTLSNIQAILEAKPLITDDVRAQLHKVVMAMFDRLVTEATSPNMYLAAVHHEGLRNFLDYIKRENIAVKGEVKSSERERFGQGLNRAQIEALIERIVTKGGEDAVRGLGLPLCEVALRLGCYENVVRTGELETDGPRPNFGHLVAENGSERLLIHVVVRNKHDRASKLNTRYILLKGKLDDEVKGTPSLAERTYGAKQRWLAIRLDGRKKYSAFLGTIDQLDGKNAISMKEADIPRYRCLAYERPYAEDLGYAEPSRREASPPRGTSGRRDSRQD